MAQLAKTIAERQVQLNKLFGPKEYKLLDYTTVNGPAILQHRCGIKKSVSILGNFLRNGNCSCQYRRTGSPNKTIAERQIDIDILHGKGEYKILAATANLEPVTVRHRCGKIITFQRYNVLYTKSGSCPCFHVKKNHRNYDLHRKEIRAKLGNDFDLFEFNPGFTIGQNTYSHKCGYTWIATAREALHSFKHCPKCAGPFGSKLKQISEKSFRKRLIERFDNNIKIIEYNGYGEKSIFKHKSGYIENIEPQYLIRKHPDNLMIIPKMQLSIKHSN